MKTFTVEFRQQQPGKMKKVPVLIRGIEVADGRLIPVTVVPVGSYDAKCWEVPFMRGNYPDEAWIGGGRKIFDAHPVRGEQTRGRPVLAKPHIGSFDNGRVLILINTEAGDEKGHSGAVTRQCGKAVTVAFGCSINKSGVQCEHALVELHPDAVLRITAGGDGQLHQKYELVNDNGTPKITPVAAESLLTVGKTEQAKVVPNGNGHRSIGVALEDLSKLPRAEQADILGKILALADSGGNGHKPAVLDEADAAGIVADRLKRSGYGDARVVAE